MTPDEKFFNKNKPSGLAIPKLNDMENPSFFSNPVHGSRLLCLYILKKLYIAEMFDSKFIFPFHKHRTNSNSRASCYC